MIHVPTFALHKKFLYIIMIKYTLFDIYFAVINRWLCQRHAFASRCVSWIFIDAYYHNHILRVDIILHSSACFMNSHLLTDYIILGQQGANLDCCQVCVASYNRISVTS